MKVLTAWLAALALVAFVGSAAAQAVPDGFQEDEEPGSEIEVDAGAGGIDARRESGAPVFAPGEMEIGSEDEPPIDDPDTPYDGEDPIDEELPGEGPEDLSGPVGEDD